MQSIDRGDISSLEQGGSPTAMAENTQSASVGSVLNTKGDDAHGCTITQGGSTPGITTTTPAHLRPPFLGDCSKYFGVGSKQCGREEEEGLGENNEERRNKHNNQPRLPCVRHSST